MLSRPRALLRLLIPAVLAAGVIVPLSAGTASAAQPICVSGTLQFDYQSAEAGPSKPTLTRGARNASVELWGRELATETDHKLNTGTQLTSAADGSFNLCYTPVNTTSMDRLFVRLATRSNQVWKVANTSGTVYTHDTPTLTNVSTNVALGAVNPTVADRAWHAFDTVNLLWSQRANSTTPCWTTAETNAATCTTLTLRWQTGSNSGPYYDLANNIYLAEDNPDSEHTVLHEAGHFFQQRLYNGTFPTVTNCNPHYIHLASSATCGWTEGFGDAVAAYLLGDNRYVFPNGDSTSFTHSAGWQTGDHVQGNVAASLLQLWNQVDGSWNRSITTLAANTPSTFADWFKNVRPTAVPPLSTTGAALTALDTHAINYGPTIVGDNAYHALSNGGGVALQRGTGCSLAVSAVAQFAALDTSRASQRWKFTANSDGTVRVFDSCPVPLTLTAPTTAGGQISLQAISLGANNQRWQVTQNSVGTYTLTNPATGYALDGTATAGQAVTANTASATLTSQKWASVFSIS
ncbi:RICIN domain-containing protein [Streptomyces anulatus]|uniref:RICIN domain-containing protein n=1 Tax=Streptomyces anulatus TaxID=1892 RepID=UPI00386ED511|nr:RICIN domain-containing protein [Streptomyces anulatus]WTE01040.1 RICIN domain-containing protein [Streptomyces anulatus]